eukprot:COSAG02_NODE_26960_length_620_cov_0.902111_2_plen_45_part_01
MLHRALLSSLTRLYTMSLRTAVRVPFGKSIRVTTELPPVPGHPEV